MNIIILGPAYPFRGGISDTNEALCRNLMKEGHKVSIWTFTLQYPSLLFPGKTQYSQTKAPEKIVIQKKINSLSPWNWIQVAKQINNIQPDLVLVRYWTPFLALTLGTIVGKLSKNIKKIAITDNIRPHENMIFQKQFTSYFCKQFDGFITLSKAVAEELSAFVQKPTLFLPHPINDLLPPLEDQLKAQQKLVLDPSKKYFLFFGLIRKYKGLDLLLKAFAHLHKKYSNTHLLVVGEHYESLQKYRDLATSLEIEASVTFENRYIPNHELSYWFSASDLVVQPYKTASQSGVTPLSIWFNKPTLVTKVGGLYESVVPNKTGWIVDPTVEGIEKGMEKYLNLKNKGSFAQNFQLQQKKLSWSHFCKECIKFSKTLP